MLQQTMLNQVASIIAYSSIIPISLFIYFYGTRAIKGSRWKRKGSRVWLSTQIGRTLMFQMFAWLAYLIFIACSLLYPNWEFGRDTTRFVIYVSLAILFWEFFIALRKLQKQPVLKGNEFGVTLDADVEKTIPPTVDKNLNLLP